MAINQSRMFERLELNNVGVEVVEKRLIGRKDNSEERTNNI